VEEMEAPPKTPKIHGIAFLISGFTRVNFREKVEEMEASPPFSSKNCGLPPIH